MTQAQIGVLWYNRAMEKHEGTGGVLPQEFKGATMDSRKVGPGMLFVAIKGEHVDGHAFIPQAMAAGAAGVIDGREGLAAAAREYRSRLRAKVVGVTGSAGKTTVKELVAAFLRAGGHKVHATSGNFNNDLGLPLTILNCPADADFLVVEMGTNHPGEIRYLVDIACPHAGVISSIGTAHIEFFGTQDGIADEKGELFRSLPPDGFAVLARENARYERLCAMSAAPVVTVSQEDPAAAEFARAMAVRLPGRHNVSNAMVAFGCANRFGVPLDACLAALGDFSLPGDRWRVVAHGGVTFISDCYNANPTSMVAALETFAAVPAAGRRFAVLGDMFELGERSSELHAMVLERALALGFDGVLVTGESFSAAANGGPAIAFATAESLKAELAVMLRPGDVVLLKASRAMRFETLLPELG